MTVRTFVPWVEPFAQELRSGRHEVVRTARMLLPEHWSLPSPLEGWTYKDLLAHLATGDWLFQTVLGAVVANEPIDLALINADSVNAGNAQRVEERKATSVDALIAEVETEGEKTQELLSRLSEAHEGRTQEGAPMSMADALRAFPGHDRGHLAQLKTALDNVML
jgi:hypothetical protein